MTDTATPSELIRFSLGLIGGMADAVSEDEITHVVLQYPENWRLAAALLADSLAARALNSPSSFSVPGEMSVSWNDRAKTWLAIATSLRKEAAAMALAAQDPVGMQSVLLEREFTERAEAEYIPRRNVKGMVR